MKKNNSGKFVLAIIVIVTVAIGIYSINHPRDTPFEGISDRFALYPFFNSERNVAHLKKLNKSREEYIAVIYIEGIIEKKNQTYDQEWLLNTVSDLLHDEQNKGIMLFIDSPGGAVYQADEAYLALKEYAEEKPVYAYMGSLAASGGYYIACAADKIYANRNTLTGSIGVIFGSSVDATGLFEKLGVKITTFHSGRNKNMGSYDEPLTEEQRQIMQSIADECYAQFTDIVAESRSLSISAVHELADGRIYTAQQAKNNGLIDGCKTSLDAAITVMEEDWFEGEELLIIECKPDYKPTFREYFTGVRTAIDGARAFMSGGTIQSAMPQYLYSR